MFLEKNFIGTSKPGKGAFLQVEEDHPAEVLENPLIFCIKACIIELIFVFWGGSSYD
jgi:hypothetical protein